MLADDIDCPIHESVLQVQEVAQAEMTSNKRRAGCVFRLACCTCLPLPEAMTTRLAPSSPRNASSQQTPHFEGLVAVTLPRRHAWQSPGTPTPGLRETQENKSDLDLRASLCPGCY